MDHATRTENHLLFPYWNYDSPRLVPRNRNIVNLTLQRTTKNSLSRAAFQLACSGLYTAALSE